MDGKADNDFAELVGQYRRRRPFVPFAIRLADGTERLVREPLHVATNGQTVLVVSSLPIRVADIVGVEERPVMTETERARRDEIVSHVKQDPFVPFSIMMVDGTRHDVVRRFQVAVGLRTGYIAPATGNGGSDFWVRDVRAVEGAVAV